MRLFSGVIVLLLLMVSAATAQTLPPDEPGSLAALNASPRHGEWVTVTGVAQDKVQAFVVYPERSGPAPVLVLIHEIFGLTDWARAVADRFAAEGFLVIAPDFVEGKTGDAARGALARLDPALIAARLEASRKYATALPAATKTFGVVGYCWGGGIAFNWAVAQPDLAAVVGFYGTAPTTADLARIHAPVLALYGGSDARVTSTMAPFRDEMARLGKRYEAEVYEGAGHAFLRQQSGMNGANLAAAQKAWPRSVAFLRAALEAKKTASMGGRVESPMFAADCCDDTSVAVRVAWELPQR